MPPTVTNPKPPITYRCKDCGEAFGGFGALGVHKRAAHPRNRPVPGSRRIEDALGGSGLPDVSADPALEPAADDEPDPEPTGGRLRPSRPQVVQTAVRQSTETTRLSVREAVADALPMSTLADLLHAVSVAVSEADGAGEAGHLSPIQCTQIAVLLYDSTVDLVVSRFDGNISRFKAGMAVLLILVSKGSIHARAIRAKTQARRGIVPVALPQPAPDAETGEQTPDVLGAIPVPVPDAMADTYRQAIERQAAMQRNGQGE